MAVQVSVIIPTYKRAILLNRCIQSLINQHFNKNDFEVIVVVDGTSLESVAGCVADDIIQYHFLETKQGAAAARNAGWKKATGELIVFTDDDCIAQPDFLYAYWNAYKNNNQPIAAFTGKIIVPLNAQPTDYEKNTAHLETAEFVTANCACTKTALSIINGFDEDFKMAWREDSDLHFKLIEHNISIKKINNAVIIHPARKADYGVSIKEQKKSMFNPLLFKKHPQLYKDKIAGKPVWRYYFMLATLLLSIIFFTFNITLGWLLLFAWLLQVVAFAIKRLQNTSHSFKHISEMLLTSTCIPFLSIYWTLYGSFRFKTWFL